MKIKKKLGTVVMALIVLQFLVIGAWTIFDWLSLPLAGIDPDGECVWIEIAPDFERRTCPAELPERYDGVHVPFVIPYNDR